MTGMTNRVEILHRHQSDPALQKTSKQFFFSAMLQILEVKWLSHTYGRWNVWILYALPAQKIKVCLEIGLVCGFQFLGTGYASMDFFSPHIQIRFSGKDPIFKYE